MSGHFISHTITKYRKLMVFQYTWRTFVGHVSYTINYNTVAVVDTVDKYEQKIVYSSNLSRFS